MMASATYCLGGCGLELKHHHQKDGRRNRGYCSLECFYSKPPKMAYAEQVWGKPIKEVVVELLNGRTSETAANLLGVTTFTLYQWIKKLGLRRVTRWEGPGSAA